MRKLASAVVGVLLLGAISFFVGVTSERSVQAAGLACPTFVYGLVPTAAQWQACFDAKQAALGYVPVNRSGDTMTGKLGLSTSTITNASLNIPQGTAPTVPVNGDTWTTTLGMYVRINGATYGPLSATPSYNASGTRQNPLHSVFGNATLSSGTVNVTLTGSAVFTDNTTYQCMVTDKSGTAASTSVTLTSGSAFTMKGTTTNVLGYFCIGN